MGHEHGDVREFGDIPYEPLGADRPRMAMALRANIVTHRLDGSEYIARFGRGGRFKVPLPQGEELLEKATFDECGKFWNGLIIRARVSIPCPPDEPYRDTVDFVFVSTEWDQPRSLEQEKPPLTVKSARSNVHYQVAAILAIGAALIVGEALNEYVTSTWRKIQTIMDRIEDVDEKTRRDPPRQSPLFIPADQ